MRKSLVGTVLAAALALTIFSSSAVAVGRIGLDKDIPTLKTTTAGVPGTGEVSLLSTSMSNFTAKSVYRVGTFSDIGTGAWYDSYVKKVFELGIMNGKGGDVFDPAGNIRISEALKMACVVHNIYNGSTAVFDQNAQPWYQPYVQYAINNSIVKQNYFHDYNAFATRANMTMLFANALPASELTAINTIGILPDVDPDSSSLQCVYSLYRAGVLTGNDSYGTFEKSSYITRAQAATIITRLAIPSERKRFVLNTVSLTPTKQERLSKLRSLYDTTNRLHDILNTAYLGDAACAYFYDNGLVLLEEYAEYNPETDDYAEGSYNALWYYSNGAVYCIVMTDPNTGNAIYTLFFDGGKLLGWEDSEGNSYYTGYRWDEMQNYYAHAKAQCDDVSSRYMSGKLSVQ